MTLRVRWRSWVLALDRFHQGAKDDSAIYVVILSQYHGPGRVSELLLVCNVNNWGRNGIGCRSTDLECVGRGWSAWLLFYPAFSLSRVSDVLPALWIRSTQCLSIFFLNCSLVSAPKPLRARITMSSRGSKLWLCLNDSRSIRLTRLRCTAFAIFFLAITRPRRGNGVSLSWANMSICWQDTLKRAFLNTGWKSAAPSRRSFLLKPKSDTGSSFHEYRRWKRAYYAVNLARPHARRRLMTRRPPRVAIRALKPWVRARLIRLGWKVLFMMMSEMLL